METPLGEARLKLIGHCLRIRGLDWSLKVEPNHFPHRTASRLFSLWPGSTDCFDILGLGLEADSEWDIASMSLLQVFGLEFSQKWGAELDEPRLA